MSQINARGSFGPRSLDTAQRCREQDAPCSQLLCPHRPFLVVSGQNFLLYLCTFRTQPLFLPRQLSSPDPDEGFFLSSPSSSSEPEEMVWMSSLSLVVPWACPATACPFSPSLSVLLDRVSTSCREALTAPECSLGQGRASPHRFPSDVQGSLFSPVVFCSLLAEGPLCSNKPFLSGSHRRTLRSEPPRDRNPISQANV